MLLPSATAQIRSFSAGRSDPGRVRSTNQDAWSADREGRLFVVADGMGGHAGGEEASRLAIESVRRYILDRWNADLNSPSLLKAALLEANDEILADQLAHRERAEMGTTLTLALYRHNEWWCAHVGDSRLYLWRNGRLEQLTQDHTWVARAVEIGELTPDQARVHPWRHVLMQCLGREDLGSMDVFQLQLTDEDILLLCSDGLSEELTDPAIATVLEQGQSIDQSAETLVEAAKLAGGRDNITVLLVKLQEITVTQL